MVEYRYKIKYVFTLLWSRKNIDVNPLGFLFVSDKSRVSKYRKDLATAIFDSSLLILGTGPSCDAIKSLLCQTCDVGNCKCLQLFQSIAPIVRPSIECLEGLEHKYIEIASRILSSQLIGSQASADKSVLVSLCTHTMLSFLSKSKDFSQNPHSFENFFKTLRSSCLFSSDISNKLFAPGEIQCLFNNNVSRESCCNSLSLATIERIVSTFSRLDFKVKCHLSGHCISILSMMRNWKNSIYFNYINRLKSAIQNMIMTLITKISSSTVTDILMGSCAKFSLEGCLPWGFHISHESIGDALITNRITGKLSILFANLLDEMSGFFYDASRKVNSIIWLIHMVMNGSWSFRPNAYLPPLMANTDRGRGRGRGWGRGRGRGRGGKRGKGRGRG